MWCKQHRERHVPLTEKPIESWRNLTDAYEALLGNDAADWVFRGQSDETKGLETTLERDFPGIDPRERGALERGLLREFQRSAHHYLACSELPEEDDQMAWLALMRHYGAPTRLLDWTHSFYAAAFFALERSEVPAAIWALDLNALRERVKPRIPREEYQLFERDPNLRKRESFRRVMGREEEPFVCDVNAYRLNPRLTIQQGTFLCTGRVTMSFEENLLATLPLKGVEEDSLRVCVIGKAKKESGALRGLYKEILGHLYRMNMNAATLYPGLEGFARSFWHVGTAFPERLIGSGKRELRAMAAG